MKNCNQCGKCCIKYGDGALSATADEIDHWEDTQPEIFKFVKDNEIWFDPETGARLTRCPFLEVAPPVSETSRPKYNCSIYLHRPEDCRHYPSLISEMIRDECEMIELVDLKNHRQAQIKLDLLMSDSRPPSGSRD